MKQKSRDDFEIKSPSSKLIIVEDLSEQHSQNSSTQSVSQLDFSDLSIDDEILAEIGTWTSTRRLKLTVSNFIRNSKESNFMLKINDKRAQVQEKIMK